MHAPMKPFFTGERAMHFLRDTVVSSSEGALFFVVAALFTSAGIGIFIEDRNPSAAVAHFVTTQGSAMAEAAVPAASATAPATELYAAGASVRAR